jgi:hypothetical protein
MAELPKDELQVGRLFYFPEEGGKNKSKKDGLVCIETRKKIALR